MPIKDEVVNLEIKAKIADMEEKRKVIETIGGKICETREETDTYFNTKKGTSLKIKEIAGASSLLYYQFDPQKKISNFKTIENFENIASLIDILKDVLEVKSIISKKKTVCRYKNIRISFSEIGGLGVFIEMQIAVKNNPKDISRAREELENIRKILNINEKDIETHGYGDIICKVNYKL